MRRRFEIGNGHDPRFRDETAHIRDDAEWRVAGAGPGLEDRRVEITGPTDRKMTINALNSGAKVWLADQEDATTPTWRNVIEGQLSLRDAIRGELDFTSPEGKEYEVTAEQTPTIVMRPRGWHLVEKHLQFIDRVGTRARGIRLARRLRAVLLPQRAAADRERPRPVLLPRQARVAAKRRSCGTTSSRSASGTSASRTARSARPC